MKSLLLMICFLSVVTASGQRTVVDGVIFEQYSNHVFGYSVNYPVEHFRVESASEDGSGLILNSSDGLTSLSLYGSESVLYDDALHIGKDIELDAYYDSKLAELPSPTYYVIRPELGWFVISGYDGDYIYYEKHISSSVCPHAGFTLRWPIDQRSVYDPLVTEISHSFTCLGATSTQQTVDEPNAGVEAGTFSPGVEFDRETKYVVVVEDQTSIWNTYVGNRCTSTMFESGVLQRAMSAALRTVSTGGGGNAHSTHRSRFPDAIGTLVVFTIREASYSETGARTVVAVPIITVVLPYSALDVMDSAFPQNFTAAVIGSYTYCGAVPSSVNELGVRVLLASGASIIANPSQFSLDFPGLVWP